MIEFDISEFVWHKHFGILLAKNFSLFSDYFAGLEKNDQCFSIRGKRLIKTFFRTQYGGSGWEKIYKVYPNAHGVYAFENMRHYDTDEKYLTLFIEELNSKRKVRK